MGLSSSLNAGVLGLSVNATKLATISDNIANSDTTGYKTSETEFSSMVLSQGRGVYTAGGVQVVTFKNVTAQGPLLATENSMDITVSGQGLIPVTDFAGLNSAVEDTNLMLTSTGSFKLDEQGYLSTLSGNYLLGWPLNADGQFDGEPTRNSPQDLLPVRLSGARNDISPTTQVELGVNLPATATDAAGDGSSFSVPIEYFDNVGSPQTLTLEFTPQIPGTGSSNRWTANVYDGAAADPTASIANFDIVFDNSPALGGSINQVPPADLNNATYNTTTGELGISTASGPLTIMIGAPGAGGPLTQFSSVFSPVGVVADGSPLGQLSDVEIDEDGIVAAVYDNGFREAIFRVPLGDVPNENGLTALSNQAFQLSSESGPVYFWDAGDGPVGTTVGYALAGSTTDVAAELTELIQTQRAYSSSAKIIQTVDEMLQETTNLIR